MTRWPVHLYQAQIMSHLLGEGWQSLLPAPQDTHHDGEHAGAAAGGAKGNAPRASPGRAVTEVSQDKLADETEVSQDKFVRTMGSAWLALQMSLPYSASARRALAALHAAREQHAALADGRAAHVRAQLADDSGDVAPGGGGRVLRALTEAEVTKLEEHLRVKRTARQVTSHLSVTCHESRVSYLSLVTGAWRRICVGSERPGRPGAALHD